jgi:hypothetical protein
MLTFWPLFISLYIPTQTRKYRNKRSLVLFETLMLINQPSICPSLMQPGESLQRSLQTATSPSTTITSEICTLTYYCNLVQSSHIQSDIFPSDLRPKLCRYFSHFSFLSRVPQAPVTSSTSV